MAHWIYEAVTIERPGRCLSQESERYTRPTSKGRLGSHCVSQSDPLVGKMHRKRSVFLTPACRRNLLFPIAIRVEYHSLA